MLILLLIMAEIALFYLPFLWRLKQPIAATLIIVHLVTLGLISWQSTGGWFFLVVLLSAFQIINLLRIVMGRMHDQFMLHACRRSFWWLATGQILGLVAAQRLDFLSLDNLLLPLSLTQLLSSIFLLCVTVRNLIKTAPKTMATFYSDKELPTLTVAVPARNETADLTSCLTNVLASSYPKLEVLVLDDCSQDRTSEIIKSFAHKGVRFLKGRPPEANWLAKNQAYQQLAEEATGDYILFMGVDVRVGAEALRNLVSQVLTRKKTMASILPLRLENRPQLAFVQPLRYWWELAPPRRLFNRPPVLSTAWLIGSKQLKKLGGFGAVSRSIIPEGYFARESVKSDQYVFIRAGESLEIRTTKQLDAQLNTALRMRYPQLHKRPENVLGLVSLEVIFLLLPFILVIGGVWTNYSLINWLALSAASCFVLNHLLIVSSTNPGNTMVALFNFPIVVLVEISLVVVSMYQYEFGVMDWRGRNICIPVMHVIPKLPPIPNSE